MPKPHEYCATERRKARGHLAAMVRTRPADDPAIDRARRRFAAAKAKGLIYAAMAELKGAINPDAPDAGVDLPMQFLDTAAAELTRHLDAAAS